MSTSIINRNYSREMQRKDIIRRDIQLHCLWMKQWRNFMETLSTRKILSSTLMLNAFCRTCFHAKVLAWRQATSMEMAARIFLWEAQPAKKEKFSFKNQEETLSSQHNLC